MIELRKVGEEAFEDIYPLLLGFRNPRMSKEDWRRMLFRYGWATEPTRGYALYADGRPVGFLGTMFSRRTLDGREERVCTFSTWIVEEAYRGSSVLLMRSVLADLEGYTIVGYTPAPTTSAVFRRLGLQSLDDEQVLLLPVPGPVQLVRALRGSFTAKLDTLERELAGVEQTYCREFRGLRARHLLLRRGSRRCYLVVRQDRRKWGRVAEVLYAGNWDFFWENRLLAHAAAFAVAGSPVLAVDARFARGRRTPFALRVPWPRLYRPAHPGIPPTAIDGLYSELLMLQE